MAKSKVPLVLKTSFSSDTTEQAAGEQVAIDLSAYVDALSGKVLRVNNVWFSMDNGSGGALPMTDFEADAPCGTIQLTTGTQTALLGPQDDRVIMQAQYYYQAVDINGASSPPQWFSILPVPDMGFYVAADTLTFMQLCSTDVFDTTTRWVVVIEAERVKLTPADINFLLVNQTIAG